MKSRVRYICMRLGRKSIENHGGQALLKEVLQNEIVEHLRIRGKSTGRLLPTRLILNFGFAVAEHINDQIDDQVREQVEYQLTYHIPATLQEEVADHKRQLEDVKRALHNSESRRANALLRSNHLGDPLHTLYMANGEVSLLFPKDLATLFSLDGTTSRQLVLDYSLPDGESRERNLNRWVYLASIWSTVVLISCVDSCNSAALRIKW
ncbi:hypothetical protein M422DRAFT_234653 [Sphaerobolus stellatus SS14]|uniref:Uncharacterized protein n=1 Tax=Sphaerobolus stellatus (strain SS14) TaxID=990650 RepID=A0A0C9U9P9_SPHS4|nr:hypothetical protein M422DRAFT_234653 [Sphaerobolus stellatus SS14]